MGRNEADVDDGGNDRRHRRLCLRGAPLDGRYLREAFFASSSSLRVNARHIKWTCEGDENLHLRGHGQISGLQP